MRVGSLFAGIGGFDLAAERAGMTVAWQSEIDPHASKVLAHHWPTVPNYGDIHAIADPPPIDVLTGGFPCQDYSVAGKGAGLAGDRGALWWQYHRLIAHLNPRWVVAENVFGLVTRRHLESFRTIVGSLVDLGYGVVWRVYDAQWFGVAQQRRRVFIVGHLGGEPRPEVLALAQGVSGDTPPSREEGSRVAALTASGLGGGGPDDNLAQGGHIVAFDWAGQTRELPKSLTTLSGGQERSETLVLGPSVRRLTPLECERLQGFPDYWTAIPGNSDTQRYRQLGNAVAVPVVERILAQVNA